MNGEKKQEKECNKQSTTNVLIFTSNQKNVIFLFKSPFDMIFLFFLACIRKIKSSETRITQNIRKLII